MQAYAWLARQRIKKEVHDALKSEATREHRKINQQVEYVLARWYEGLDKKERGKVG